MLRVCCSQAPVHQMVQSALVGTVTWVLATCTCAQKRQLPALFRSLLASGSGSLLSSTQRAEALTPPSHDGSKYKLSAPGLRNHEAPLAVIPLHW